MTEGTLGCSGGGGGAVTTLGTALRVGGRRSYTQCCDQHKSDEDGVT
jgi:hypothetical protein